MAETRVYVAGTSDTVWGRRGTRRRFRWRDANAEPTGFCIVRDGYDRGGSVVSGEREAKRAGSSRSRPGGLTAAALLQCHPWYWWRCKGDTD